MDFDLAFDRLLGNEGGYSNNPSDPGKETMWGVTLGCAREYGYIGQMAELPRDTAKAIYFKKYWLFIGADQYDGAVGFQVFDAAVNHGPTEAAKLLQHAAGVPADGDIGPQTQAAIASFSVPALILRFNAARLRFYGELSTFPTFGRGWTTNRIPNNLDFAATDLST